MKRTPIECASTLRNLSVIKVLLEYHIDEVSHIRHALRKML
jgi:hypothetical protein